jgi:hypothetical protein
MRTSISPASAGANFSNVSVDRSMILDVSAGPQSLMMHVVIAPVAGRVTRTTVPRGIVVWAQVPSGAPNQDATPRALWVPNGRCAGATGVGAGRSDGRVIPSVVVGRATVVEGPGATTVVVAAIEAAVVGGAVDEGVAGAGAAVVGGAGAATNVDGFTVVVGATTTGSSATTRAGSNQVAGGDPLRANSGPAASPPSPRSATIGTRRTDANTPAK